MQHVRYNLPTLIKEIVSEITSTGKSGDIKDLASGLVTAVSKSIDYFNLRHAGKGVVRYQW